jgi:hypothetical protein
MPSFTYSGADDRFTDLPTITLEHVGDHFSFVARGWTIGLSYMISGKIGVQQAGDAAQKEDGALPLVDVLHETGLHEPDGVTDQSEEWESYVYTVPAPLWPDIRHYLRQTLDKTA